MKTIIITGSNGFIGSCLVDALSQQYRLILLLRNKNNLKKTNYTFNKNISVKFFKNNNELSIILKKIKALWLIHCATHYVKQHNAHDITKIINSNIEFGTILLDNLNIMRVKNFINFSTIWENYDGIKDNSNNLYSASKQAFEKIINYYNTNNEKINFYRLIISDTYGEKDKRKKLINILQKNITNRKRIKIISKNLFINLLNVNDIVSGIHILLENNIKPGKYNMINKNKFNINKLINQIQKKIKFKLKIKWLSSKKIDEKIYKYKSLPGWKPDTSSLDDLVKFVLKDYKT